jgi:hypothetical protein
MITLPPALEADALPWSATRLGAGLLLLLWLAVAAVLSARELRFLAGLDSRARRVSIIQHVLMQLAVLLILLPCMIASAPSLTLFYCVGAGFAMLWAAGSWSVMTRYAYTSRLLDEHRASLLLSEALERSAKEDQSNEGGRDDPASI